MGKRKTKPKQDTRGPLQRAVDAEATARLQSELDVITPEMRAKPNYTGTRSTIINNHDPVMRWIALGRLSETQQQAISYMRRLWELSGLWQRVTANYGHSVGGGGNAEHRAALEIDAREDLHRIRGYIPPVYMEVFENVCRWGHPAGTAGELLSEGSNRAADVRAHLCVCFVADLIAMKERV